MGLGRNFSEGIPVPGSRSQMRGSGVAAPSLIVENKEE